MRKQIACAGTPWAVLAAVLVLFAGCPNPEAPSPDRTPKGTVVINNDDAYTVVTTVTLALSASGDSRPSGMRMMISNAADFAEASWEDFASTRGWTLTAGDGPKAVCVKFMDAAGNESAICSDSILLDSTLPGPPGAPALAAADDTGVSNSDGITRHTMGLTFSGTGGESGATMRLYDAVRGLLGSATADGAGNWSLDLDLGEGTYVLFARAVLKATGAESPSSPSLLVTVDTTPPGVPSILEPSQGENTGANKRPVIRWASVAGADTYDLLADDGNDFSSVEYSWTNLSGTNYTPSADMSASSSIPAGTRYYLQMRALDAAGNTGAWSNPGVRRYVNVGRFDNDFNGDGFADAIVGAHVYDHYRGRAYIFYGGSSMDDIADVTMSGEATNDFFGYSVASAGDVNGDGYADALIGAQGYNSYQGRAYIYYGGSSMDNNADVIMTGETTENYFGYFGCSVASAGDVNGDGCADAIVGADEFNGREGRVYIYYGGSAMDNSADVTMNGVGGFFGRSVASAGDLNGDGYVDAIVGEGFEGLRGRAYIFYGGSSMDDIPDVIMSGTETTGRNFGKSVASIGDANGDGYADAIVGADGYLYYQGRAYIYYGGSSMDSSADITVTGEATGNNFACSVASAGDVNGDGYSDAIVGEDSVDGQRGRAYIFYGGSSMDDIPDVTMSGEATVNFFGCSVSSAGDVNGDGYADAIAGACGYNHGQGRAYIYCGGSSMDNSAEVTITGEATTNLFGCSVASAWGANGHSDGGWIVAKRLESY